MENRIEKRNNRIAADTAVYCLKYFNGPDEVQYEAPVEMELLNISRNGLGIVSPISFENGCMLLLNIRLDAEHFEKVSARVIWQTPMEDKIRYGLSISNMSGRLYTYLDALDNGVNTQI